MNENLSIKDLQRSPKTPALTWTLSQDIDHDGNVDVDSILDLAR
jgi:hypothetical protein